MLYKYKEVAEKSLSKIHLLKIKVCNMIVLYQIKPSKLLYATHLVFTT